MITSREQLLQLYEPPAERALLKQQWELDRHCLRFIALSPFLVMDEAASLASSRHRTPTPCSFPMRAATTGWTA